MGVRITSMVLRVSALLAIILGILFWTSSASDALIPIHMLLGIIIVVALWILGYFIATARGNNLPLTILAVVVGIAVLALGLTQQQLFSGNEVANQLIKVLHLVLGLLAIGVGEMISARYKRLKRAL